MVSENVSHLLTETGYGNTFTVAVFCNGAT